MNLLFRTDASVKIGTGHVMRCLALAEFVQDAGGRTVFAMAETTPAIEARLARESCEIVRVSDAAGSGDDAQQTVVLARQQQADWVVVDGYQFGADYQDGLRAAGCRVLFFDDYGHASRYSAQLILNQNAGASERLYVNRDPDTRLLLGPRYALLRREFSVWRGWKRDVSQVCRRLLVMMGGSDPGNLTAGVIEALRLAQIENLEVTAVVGGSNPHFSMLHELASTSGLNMTVRNDVSDMAELMAEADIAISAAGSTCWELCLLSLPALLIDVAANQNALARELDARGCAIHVGNTTVDAGKIAQEVKRLASSSELRESLSRNAGELVDGKGTERVAVILCGEEDELAQKNFARHDLGDSAQLDRGLRLRSARPEDGRLLWEWANDPEVRAAAFSGEPISWETHSRWFAERLGRGATHIWIAENEDGTACGQIRFDARPDGDWEVDISVARTMRGRGLSSRLITLGIAALDKERLGARVHAFVKPENRASLRAFETAGFERIGTEQIHGHATIHFIFISKKAKPI